MAKSSKKQQVHRRTLVTFLLDRTGSMAAVRDDTIGAFNTYLDTLKGAPVDFTLVQFDSVSIDKVCVRIPIDEVKPLTHDTYEPRASTPLIDAAYKTIKAVEASLNGGNPKVVICIQTDGGENSSTEHTWDELNALIKEKAAAGWQFNFMEVGLDAYTQGAKMGIAAQSTVSYNIQDVVANRATFKNTASNTRAYAMGLASDTHYSADQKAQSGDQYARQVAQAVPPAATPKHSKPNPIVDNFTL
jgi:hypothetical protein